MSCLKGDLGCFNKEQYLGFASWYFVLSLNAQEMEGHLQLTTRRDILMLTGTWEPLLYCRFKWRLWTLEQGSRNPEFRRLAFLLFLTARTFKTYFISWTTNRYQNSWRNTGFRCNIARGTFRAWLPFCVLNVPWFEEQFGKQWLITLQMFHNLQYIETQLCATNWTTIFNLYAFIIVWK